MNHSWAILVLVLLFALGRVSAAGWEKQDSGTLAWLHSVFFLDKDRGWIAGSNGTLLATGNAGRTWIKVKTKKSDTFRDVYFSDPENGWILCERGVYDRGNKPVSYLLTTENGGKDWQTIDFPKATGRLARLIFAPAGNAFAVGEGGVLLRMQNERTVWSEVSLPVRYLILDGVFTSPVNGILVGGGGTALRTDDGGATWVESKTSRSVSQTKLNAIHFHDQMTGWVAGDQGRIATTSDGGHSWRELYSNTSVDLRDIAFVNGMLGFAVGGLGTILKTVDGGSNWTVDSSATKHPLESIALAGNRSFAVGYGGTILTFEIGRGDP